jgi:cell division inhibitor SulA
MMGLLAERRQRPANSDSKRLRHYWRKAALGWNDSLHEDERHPTLSAAKSGFAGKVIIREGRAEAGLEPATPRPPDQHLFSPD